jgi:hypothetical protein
MRFRQADFYITKDDTLTRTAARESLPKCIQLFQTAIGFQKSSKSPIGVGLSGSTEAGYMPVMVTCPPQKCDFLNFFSHSHF